MSPHEQDIVQLGAAVDLGEEYRRFASCELSYRPMRGFESGTTVTTQARADAFSQLIIGLYGGLR